MSSERHFKKSHWSSLVLLEDEVFRKQLNQRKASIYLVKTVVYIWFIDPDS